MDTFSSSLMFTWTDSLHFNHLIHSIQSHQNSGRVATVREKYLENEIFSRSWKSQGISWIGREISKGLGKSGKSQGI